MKKYVVFFSAINAGAIYLILHYGGTNKWTILSLFIGAEFLAWYFFVSNNKKMLLKKLITVFSCLISKHNCRVNLAN